MISHFGGPIGQLIVEMQERVLFDFLGEVHNASILDVGTGTGRAALAIAKRGAHVTGIDASAEMLRVAQKHAEDASLNIKFLRGDAHALDFADQSCDAVVSLRMLMHTPDWRRCIGEMCRVARQRVIFDYPPMISASALQVGVRRAAQLVGRRVEAYHVIRTGAIRSALNRNGFEIVQMNCQFVAPIAFHKLIGSRRFTLSVEGILASIGLSRLMGSPVTILAMPSKKSVERYK